MRDDVEREMRLAVRLVGDFVDRQRDAIDGDRALGRDMRRERRGRRDGDGHAVADGFDRHDAPDVVDMAGDDMPAQLVADLQRAFEVQAAAGGPHPRRGARERFGARVDREPVTAGVGSIGRASWRESVCQYGEISVVSGPLKTKYKKI